MSGDPWRAFTRVSGLPATSSHGRNVSPRKAPT